MMNLSKMLSRIVIGMAGLVTSCGEARLPEAYDQVAPNLSIPSGETGFFLTNDQTNIVYNGSVLLWDSEVTPAQIGRIAQSSADDRQLKSRILAFVAEKLTPAQLTVETAEKALADATATKEADRDRKARSNTKMIPVMQELVEEWFERRLAELVEHGDVLDGEHARNHFRAYCEGKVWELAASRLATLAYTFRPTPNQMCEAHYRSAGLFTGQLCEAPQVGAKSFFQCLWREGVLKTQLASMEWAALPCGDNTGDHYPSRKEAVLAWLDSSQGPSLIEQLIDDTEMASSITEQTYSDLFAEKIMLGDKLPIKIVRRAPDVERCKLAFSRSELRTESQAVAWQLQDPRLLLPIGESDGTSSSAYTLIPSTGDSEVNTRNWSLLAKFVGLFGGRRVLPELNQGIAVSVNDGIFLKPKGFDLVASKVDRCAVIGPDDSEEPTADCLGDPAFESVRDYLSRLVDPELAREEAVTKRALQRAKSNAKKAQKVARAFLSDDLPAQIAEGVAASSDPGAAVALMGYVLRVSPVGNQVHLALQFADGKKAVTGCFLVKSGENCGGESSSDMLSAVSVRHELGEIAFAVDLSSPGNGMQHRKRGGFDPYFNEAIPAELSSSRLRFKIYPNQLGELHFLTGNVWVERGEEVLYEGSTSADAFGQQVPNITD